MRHHKTRRASVVRDDMLQFSVSNLHAQFLTHLLLLLLPRLFFLLKVLLSLKAAVVLPLQFRFLPSYLRFLPSDFRFLPSCPWSLSSHLRSPSLLQSLSSCHRSLPSYLPFLPSWFQLLLSYFRLFPACLQLVTS